MKLMTYLIYAVFLTFLYLFYFFLILFFRTLLKFHVVNRKTDEVLEATNVVTYAVYMFLFLIFVTRTFILTIAMNVLFIPE